MNFLRRRRRRDHDSATPSPPGAPPRRDARLHRAASPPAGVQNEPDPALRLPHERDESSDEQSRGPTGVMHRAHDDVRAGRVDTDARGDKASEAFERASSNDRPLAGKITAALLRKRRRP